MMCEILCIDTLIDSCIRIGFAHFCAVHGDTVDPKALDSYSSLFGMMEVTSIHNIPQLETTNQSYKYRIPPIKTKIDR